MQLLDQQAVKIWDIAKGFCSGSQCTKPLEKERPGLQREGNVILQMEDTFFQNNT